MTVSSSAAHASKANIKAEAVRFVDRWKDTTSEQADRQTFWNEFLALFGVERRQVGIFEQIAKRASTGGYGWVDLLWPGQMGVEHKSKGGNLTAAMAQLVDYLPSLPSAELPWLLVACDFGTFKWQNLDTGDSGDFALADLADHLDLFWWMAGYNRPHESFENEEDANLAATQLLADVHDRLRDSGYPNKDLREWLTRILFCLFADDTGVWDRAAFHAYLALHTAQDGSDLGPKIAYIFQLLDTPGSARPANLDEDLASFVYVNGDLFATRLSIPACDEKTRDALLRACRFDWGVISPAIFGSMFQNVMTSAERRALGAHYTTEENILRTIAPLFLNDLRQELDAATSLPKLNAFHDKLGSLTFMDPACGCGNFLVIAYREIRVLETEALRRIAKKEAARGHLRGQTKGQLTTNLDLLCKVRVDQFYGIEIDEWPARIARTAMYLIDHIANREVSAEFGQHYVRFPIPASPHIAVGNALRLDWNTVLPAQDADYVFGNPPFVGFRLRSDEQQEDLKGVMAASVSRRIDYVLGWYAKALDYIDSYPIGIAFVSTNSITQGEQAPVLAKLIADSGATIVFAHRTFAWANEARGAAHVHVVIIGLSKTPPKQRLLFEYPDIKAQPVESTAANINAYLVDGPSTVIDKRRQPLVSGIPIMAIGSKPNDNGNLIVEANQVAEVRADPVARKYLKRLVGSREFIRSEDRWCLWLVKATAAEIRGSRLLRDRVSAVRAHRLASDNAATRATADTPSLFWSNMQPAVRYLALPEVSSERRRVVPMGYLDPDVIATNKIYLIPDAPLWLFGVLQSTMFATWARTVGGRMKSDISLSPGSVYNTFPFVVPDDGQRRKIESAAKVVLKARAAHPNVSLALLYDPLVTPPDVLTAHRKLDRAVDALFNPTKRAWSEAERLKDLFRRYIATSQPKLP